MVLLGLILVGNCNIWFACGGNLGNWCFGWFLFVIRFRVDLI